MFRLVISAVALAGIISLAQPAFADGTQVSGAGHLQATAADTEHPAALSPSQAPSSAAPAGFGWG